MSDFYGVGLIGVPYNAIKPNYSQKTEKYAFVDNSIMNHPRKEEKSNTGAKVAASAVGLIAAGVLAYVFRGKIKATAPKVTQFAKDAWQNCKDFAQKGYGKVKPYIDKTLTKGKEVIDKGVNFVKPYVNKTINFFKNLVK